MSSTPTVDRFRYPWRRMVPGDTHYIFLHWEGDPDVSASTFTVEMVDAFTAEPVVGVTYTVDETDANIGTVSASAPIPVDISVVSLYEIRVRQDAQVIVAGPVMFAAAVVPVVTP